MPVRERGGRSPGSQPARPFSRPQSSADRRQSAGRFAYTSGFTAETDWLLEGDGFELSVPRSRKSDSFEGGEAPKGHGDDMRRYRDAEYLKRNRGF